MSIYERSVSIVFDIINSNNQKGISIQELLTQINNDYKYTIFPSNIEDIIEMNIYSERIIQENNRLFLTEEGKKTLAFATKNSIVTV